jgi:hypothetical protein
MKGQFDRAYDAVALFKVDTKSLSRSSPFHYGSRSASTQSGEENKFL